MMDTPRIGVVERTDPLLQTWVVTTTAGEEIVEGVPHVPETGVAVLVFRRPDGVPFRVYAPSRWLEVHLLEGQP